MPREFTRHATAPNNMAIVMPVSRSGCPAIKSIRDFRWRHRFRRNRMSSSQSVVHQAVPADDPCPPCRPQLPSCEERGSSLHAAPACGRICAFGGLLQLFLLSSSPTASRSTACVSTPEKCLHVASSFSKRAMPGQRCCRGRVLARFNSFCCAGKRQAQARDLAEARNASASRPVLHAEPPCAC
jgi:hypothetical protein